jgi:L-ascorbate metabolism protein UlaG (beta-lactamase superfamily)
MEITWFGQSCFRLRERGGTVITDPYGPDLGLILPRNTTTTIITVSHDHPDHNAVRGFRGSPYIISGPGEYEVGGIFVIGVATFHDDKQGRELGKNTAYLIEIDDLTVCHLGDLGHALSQEQVEELNGVDVLLVPVGGHTTLNATRAAEVVNVIEPKIVIPMHYKVPGLTATLDTVTRFLREMAVEPPAAQEMLKVSKTDLPEETQVVVLAPQQ